MSKRHGLVLVLQLIQLKFNLNLYQRNRGNENSIPFNMQNGLKNTSSANVLLNLGL